MWKTRRRAGSSCPNRSVQRHRPVFSPGRRFAPRRGARCGQTPIGGRPRLSNSLRLPETLAVCVPCSEQRTRTPSPRPTGAEPGHRHLPVVWPQDVAQGLANRSGDGDADRVADIDPDCRRIGLGFRVVADGHDWRAVGRLGQQPRQNEALGGGQRGDPGCAAPCCADRVRNTRGCPGRGAVNRPSSATPLSSRMPTSRVARHGQPGTGSWSRSAKLTPATRPR